jgi:hypothetical protein
LIPELLNASSWGILKQKRDTNVMIPHKRKCTFQEIIDFLKIFLITLPQLKKRMILTCFRCLVPVIMIRMYVLCHNRFLKFQVLEYVTYIVKHPVSKVLLYDKLSLDLRASLTFISKALEPKSFQEAQSRCMAAGYDKRIECTC